MRNQSSWNNKYPKYILWQYTRIHTNIYMMKIRDDLIYNDSVVMKGCVCVCVCYIFLPLKIALSSNHYWNDCLQLSFWLKMSYQDLLCLCDTWRNKIILLFTNYQAKLLHQQLIDPLQVEPHHNFSLSLCLYGTFGFWLPHKLSILSLVFFTFVVHL